MKARAKHVFIIDDEPLARETVADILQSNGFQTAMADDIESVLEFDMPLVSIVIDIFMPGVGGIEGIRRLREKWPDARIIAMSGGYGDVDKHQALAAAKRIGADDVLPKPFTEEDLLKAMGGASWRPD